MKDPFDNVEVVGSAVAKGELVSKPTDPGYFWAGRNLSFKEACQHFVAVGATGAGKSITLNLLLQSILSKRDNKKRRVIVYDSKTDLVGLLGGLCGGMERLRILNPLDERFVPWDLSADITNAVEARELAAMLIPKNDRESSPYFTDTARSLVAGVAVRLIAETSKNTQQVGVPLWTLRDLIEAFESIDRLQQFLDHPKTRYLKDHFSLENRRTFSGVKSTVDTCLDIYRPIAALMYSSKNRAMSFKEWAQAGDSVLVFGNNELSREATDTFNRLMLCQASKALLARDGTIDSEKDETWIFLDELREAGSLPGLRQLLLRGRSKGISVAMGFQDVEGVFAVYGEHEGAEIIGAAQNAIILHINPAAPSTAKWASDVFSSRLEREHSRSRSYGKEYTHGEQEELQLKPNVYPIQFVELSMPTLQGGLHFYSFTNRDGYRRFTYPWENDFLENEGYFKLVEQKAFQDFILTGRWESSELEPWSLPDFSRLKFQPKDDLPLRSEATAHPFR